jgi:hypothetical protein
VSRHPEELARRYVAWLRRHALAILAVHVVLVAIAVYLVKNHLPLYADFSYLLPQDAPAVQDLRKLEARIRPTDMVLVVVQAPDATSRAEVTQRFAERARAIRDDLVERVEDDDAETRAFFKARRHLFVPLDDLKLAQETLDKHIKRAKLKANPLFIDLDEDDAAAADQEKTKKKLEELQQKRKEAEARLDKSSHVSADGKTALIQVKAAFRATDAGRGRQLLDELGKVRDELARTHPQVQIGFAANIVIAVAEHDALIRGMILSGAITAVLVGLVLVAYFRSATVLALLIGMLVASTVISFGLAALTVGHLNAATAFLGAIIAGNGVNYGILLIARYMMERRRLDADDAMAASIAGTLRPTAIASLGAAIAYGSLAATSFKGFADFAIIGAIGMLVLWLATYVLLPTLILRWGQGARQNRETPLIGAALVKLIGFRNSPMVCAVALVATAIATAITVRYVLSDPFEYDIKQLRSEGADAVEARSWMAVSDKHFGRGISARTYIAADREDQVPKIIAALRKQDANKPPAAHTFGPIHSILDVVPDHQQEKLAVLAKIRALLDDGALDALDEKERAELRAMRPPDGLAVITPQSLPADIRDKLTERDGRIGYLIAIRPGLQLDEWNGRDLIRFANAVRKIDLGDEQVTTSGSSVIFADIVSSIATDGPLVTGIATVGLTLMVLLLVGVNRRAFAVLAGTASGSLLMVATCALLGIRVNFLDFVALPITLGLGIDYAINVAYPRFHGGGDEVPDPIETLRTSGAVFVCSLTTIIGYGSLLVSENLAIRGFGTVALIGEIACVLTALVVVPAIIAVGRSHQPRQGGT